MRFSDQASIVTHGAYQANKKARQAGFLSIMHDKSVEDFGDDAGADRSATFADRKTQALFHRNRAISVTTIFTLSPGITISTPSGKLTRTRHIRRTEVKLRTVALEERRVTTTFILRQNVNLSLKLGVRVNEPGFAST